MSYDTELDSWNKEPPLNIGRNSHVMVAVNQVAYAIGKLSLLNMLVR